MTVKQLCFSLACFLSISAWQACGDDDPNDKGPACSISNADLGYSKNIKRIVDQQCISCHAGSGPGPGDYRTFEGVKKVAEDGSMLEQVVIDKVMPQSGGSMTQAQRDSINCWIKAGFPQ